MANVMLFGPPGIGKSTIIGILKSNGVGAIDLEDLYPSRIRFQIPGIVEGKVIGAADLNPRRQYNNTIKVLLTADQSVYDSRRNARDRRVSGKSKQVQHDVTDWLTPGTFDFIIDTTNQSQYSTYNEILKIMKKAGIKK